MSLPHLAESLSSPLLTEYQVSDHLPRLSSCVEMQGRRPLRAFAAGALHVFIGSVAISDYPSNRGVGVQLTSAFSLSSVAIRTSLIAVDNVSYCAR